VRRESQPVVFDGKGLEYPPRSRATKIRSFNQLKRAVWLVIREQYVVDRGLELNGGICGFHIATGRTDPHVNKTESLSDRIHEFAAAVQVPISAIKNLLKLQLVVYEFFHAAPRKLCGTLAEVELFCHACR